MNHPSITFIYKILLSFIFIIALINFLLLLFHFYLSKNSYINDLIDPSFESQAFTFQFSFPRLQQNPQQELKNYQMKQEEELKNISLGI